METNRTPSEAEQTAEDIYSPSLYVFLKKLFVFALIAGGWCYCDWHESQSIWIRLFFTFAVLFEGLFVYGMFPRRCMKCPFCEKLNICGATVCWSCNKDIKQP